MTSMTTTWNRQRPSGMPSHRYRDVFDRVDVPLTERAWPARRLTAAPLWVPVDLRDGNQALAEPMDPERKRRFFELLVAMGYKEIEVGYPSASQTDFDFVRLLASSDLAPPDVTIVVFTPARRDLIERTVDSVRGLRNPVVIHLYTATAPTWRDVVLGHSRDALRTLVLEGARDVLELSADLPDVRFEFSPEVFNLTEPDYVLDICDAVTAPALWDATPERPVILNLPATVEVATPNVYADQIEHMHTSLARRDSVILSVHPHNDRGTGIACAELAVLAGAQRVEGCVFGNGERTGNVDIATLALNLHAQGIDPMVDFSDIDEIRRTVEHCNRIEIHPRHPYVGDLVHTAFSGTHQDAIRKGLAEHRTRAAELGKPEGEIEWRVPYLPVDPADLGRSYEAVIRVNSQSGKGGVAWVLEQDKGLKLPKKMQASFSHVVQALADETSRELAADDIWQAFEGTYLATEGKRFQLVDWSETHSGADRIFAGKLTIDGTPRSVSGRGNGLMSSVIAALAESGGPLMDIVDYSEHAIGQGSNVQAAAYVECRTAGGKSLFGCGLDTDVATASVRAILSAANGA